MKKTILAVALAVLTNVLTSQAKPAPTPKPPAPFPLKENYAYNFANKYAKGAVVSFNGNTYVALGKVPAGYYPSSYTTNLWLNWASSLDPSSITNPAIVSALSYALGLDSPNVAIGFGAGYTNQQGAVAIGSFAGHADQGGGAVAIGVLAGETSQGYDSVAIGDNAGIENQGDDSVAIGKAGTYAQGSNSVAIGLFAGWTNQGDSSVAIGYYAGANNQGQNAVAIGNRAGQFNQASNSIVINATADNLGTSSGGFYAKPIRRTNSAVGLLPLYYNTNTGEIMVVTP